MCSGIWKHVAGLLRAGTVRGPKTEVGPHRKLISLSTLKMETIVVLMPQSFIDCGIGKVVLVGDCKDHDVHDESGSLAGHADLCTHRRQAGRWRWGRRGAPTGFVAVAADLVLGCGSEQELSKAVACGGALVFCDIPAQSNIAFATITAWQNCDCICET